MGVFYVFFFFFKQKTAYEMLRSLVGSEMCIRDRSRGQPVGAPARGRIPEQEKTRRERPPAGRPRPATPGSVGGRPPAGG